MKDQVGKFIEIWGNLTDQFKGWPEFEADLRQLIEGEKQKAIAEHEQWKEYPKEKPKEGEYYCVSFEDGVVYAAGFIDGEWTANARIIAFRELPAPYQPTEEGGENGTK